MQQQKRLSMWRIIKYACLGVPIFVKHLDRPWKDVLTPRFPLFFSVLGWLLVMVLCFVTGIFRLGLFTDEYGISDIGAYAGYCFGGFVIWCWIPIVINLFLLGWCMLLLLILKNHANDIKVIHGAQRVTYFSAFFQAIFIFVAYSSLGWQAVNADITGFGVTVLKAILWLIVGLACIVRLMTVFQGMRRESNGSVLVGFLSIFACLDIWCPVLVSLFLV